MPLPPKSGFSSEAERAVWNREAEIAKFSSLTNMPQYSPKDGVLPVKQMPSGWPGAIPGCGTKFPHVPNR